MFVFRNYTIENLFNEEVTFSGYGDISYIPESDSYVWFYISPINTDLGLKVKEIQGISDKLSLVSSRIPSSVPFYIVTLEDIFALDIVSSDQSCSTAIDKVNALATEMASRNLNIRIINLMDFLSRYNKSEWINWKFYFLSQMVINPKISPDFKEWWKEQIESFSRVRKKCIVLDLDNTLWDGVLGEDGISGIRMSGDYPGNAFMYFQEGLIQLEKSGVILSVCSKNNEDDVKELWNKNPFVKLTPDHISAYRINWNNKADNIRELAKELNIGLDSMVFIDDNPSERELVKQQLPMVSVPDFPKRPYDLMKFFAELVKNYFRTYRLTEEDLKKTEQYKANAQRNAEQSKFTDLSDYIKSLDIIIDVIAANEFNIARIAQMTQKTNQFNLTTHRYSESDLNSLLGKGAEIYCISVKDKFGDSGITGTIIVNKDNNNAEIDTFLLSCRILGKDIESVFINSVLNRLIDKGVKSVRASYIPTLKNKQVMNFYDRIGFDLISNEEGLRKYSLHLNNKLPISDLYTVNFK